MRNSLTLMALLLGCSFVGCESQTNLEPADDGGGASTMSLVLREMPEGQPRTPTEVKELGETATPTILAGRIDAGSMDPFESGKVAFMISQLPDEGHGADDPDHADNCPFCAHKLSKAPRAIVQFRGLDGNVLAGDARKELSLSKGDVVYVTGSAQYDPALKTVMVDATGVYRKPKK